MTRALLTTPAMLKSALAAMTPLQRNSVEGWAFEDAIQAHEMLAELQAKETP
jgi:hypothetical protein